MFLLNLCFCLFPQFQALSFICGLFLLNFVLQLKREYSLQGGLWPLVMLTGTVAALLLLHKNHSACCRLWANLITAAPAAALGVGLGTRWQERRGRMHSFVWGVHFKRGHCFVSVCLCAFLVCFFVFPFSPSSFLPSLFTVSSSQLDSVFLLNMSTVMAAVSFISLTRHMNKYSLLTDWLTVFPFAHCFTQLVLFWVFCVCVLLLTFLAELKMQFARQRSPRCSRLKRTLSLQTRVLLNLFCTFKQFTIL